MIAIEDSGSARASASELPVFEDLMPAISKQAAVAFRASPPSEREDLIAETVAHA